MNGDGMMDVLMTSADYNIFYLPLMPDGTYGEPVIIYYDEVFDGDGDLVASTFSFADDYGA